MEKTYILRIVDDGKNVGLNGDNNGFNDAEIIGHLQTAIHTIIENNKPKKQKRTPNK